MVSSRSELMPLSNAAPQELIKSCRDCKVGPFRPVMINSNLHNLEERWGGRGKGTGGARAGKGAVGAKAGAAQGQRGRANNATNRARTDNINWLSCKAGTAGRHPAVRTYASQSQPLRRHQADWSPIQSKIEADGPDAKQSEKHHVQLQLHQARVMSRQQ